MRPPLLLLRPTLDPRPAPLPKRLLLLSDSASASPPLVTAVGSAELETAVKRTKSEARRTALIKRWGSIGVAK